MRHCTDSSANHLYTRMWWASDGYWGRVWCKTWKRKLHSSKKGCWLHRANKKAILTSTTTSWNLRLVIKCSYKSHRFWDMLHYWNQTKTTNFEWHDHFHIYMYSLDRESMYNIYNRLNLDYHTCTMVVHPNNIWGNILYQLWALTFY